MQDRHLCWPPYLFLGPAVPPHFFHYRIATGFQSLKRSPSESVTMGVCKEGKRAFAPLEMWSKTKNENLKRAV